MQIFKEITKNCFVILNVPQPHRGQQGPEGECVKRIYDMLFLERAGGFLGEVGCWPLTTALVRRASTGADRVLCVSRGGFFLSLVLAWKFLEIVLLAAWITEKEKSNISACVAEKEKSNIFIEISLQSQTFQGKSYVNTSHKRNSLKPFKTLPQKTSQKNGKNKNIWGETTGEKHIALITGY